MPLKLFVPIVGVLAGALAGCGSEECSLPRRGDEQSCDSYDGGQLRFVVGEPISDISAFCASPCVDVFAPIAISGYDDLRKVPLLPKVRLVHGLGINLDTLRDLRGLEKVDVIRSLSFSGLNGDTSPRTLEGLIDEEIWSVSLDQVSGLASLEGASLRRVDTLAVSRSSVQRLDLSGVEASYLNVVSNDELRSVAIASGAMKQVIIEVNPLLTELSWGPGLTVRSQLRVDSNSALSSCLVQQFAEQTDAGVPRTEFIRNNGPCP
ncbi:MAG: hypothetical protein Q8L48_43685 [Archangium sp.]|nr:hypothetical protein [Archangium sp.]